MLVKGVIYQDRVCPSDAFTSNLQAPEFAASQMSFFFAVLILKIFAETVY